MAVGVNTGSVFSELIPGQWINSTETAKTIKSFSEGAAELPIFPRIRPTFLN